MASTFQFCEDNGTGFGSPAHGAVRTSGRAECNWKNIDDSTTAYSASPVTAGNNSFGKYQYGAITGAFNQVSNGKWGHTTGIFGAGLTLVTKITSGYTAPATTALAGGIDITLSSGIASASQAVLFKATGPEASTGTTSLNTVGTGYTDYLVTQLQTTVAAAPGDTASITLTFQYDES
jgi:hypothetical protein